MPSEFRAVEAYLSHLLQNRLSEASMPINMTSSTTADQKVPQLSTFSMMEDDIYIKSEPIDFGDYLKFNDPFNFSEGERLAPLTSSNCTRVEINDQQLSADHSPSHLLDLDQVSNDMTFYPDTIPAYEIKQEVMDSDMAFESYSQDSSMILEQTTQQSMENFLINQVKKDIQTACAALNLSSDPFVWNVEQTRSWIIWTLQQYQLPTNEAYLFQMPGALLCMMNESDFTQRSSECGSTLYSQLEIWKNACKLYEDSEDRLKPSVIAGGPYMSYPEVNSHPAPSVSPAPSTCSLESAASSSASSTGFPVNNSIQFDLLSGAVEREAVTQKTVRSGNHEHKQTIHLWQFLKELLVQAQTHGNCIKWLDREKGVFKIEDSSKVARLWGKRKNRPAMNYDKLSRSIRQYYKKGIIKKTEHSKRLVYQFCRPYLS